MRLPGSMTDWRSTPLVIFGFALLILLAAVGLILQNEATYRSDKLKETIVQADVLAESVKAALDFNDPVAAQEAVNAIRANPQVRRVALFNRSNRLIASFSRAGLTVPPTLEAQNPTPPPNLVRAIVPVMSSGQRVGTVLLAVEREPVSRRATRYILLGLLSLLVALVVVVLGMAQAALRKANRQLSERAAALAEANELLEEQMEQRAHAEEQLRQAQKMQALGQLTGGIAHDFNNLLTVIQGSADMLTQDNLPEHKRKRFAQAIVQASTNAAALTSQLLAFARRQPLKPEKLDVNELIRAMDDLLKGTIGERIELVTQLSPTGCTVELDRNQLQSAILNIASNARDAMPDGGRLTISTTTATGADGVTMVALEISDTGVGMDTETVGRVFEPFFTTKSAGQGTGLGLSQVYGFASQSGGDVLVLSEPEVGTAVTMLLPCSEATDAPRPAAAEAEVAVQNTADILVVEDNEEVGAFAEALLGELGHKVTRAGSGEEALDLCRERRFDVVFSDVVMPGMGGLELAEILGQEMPDVPVVLATGYSPEIAQSGSGGRPVILKPYRLATLAEAMRKVLQPS